MGRDVVARTAAAADAAAGHAGLDHGVRDLDRNDTVEMDARRLEGFCLRDRAGHTVEDEPVRTVRLGDPFRDDADDDIVRNQLAGVHKALGLEASGCTRF